MTRQEFIDEVTEPYEVYDFCMSNGLEDLVENVYDSETYDSFVEDEIGEILNYDSWEAVLNYLSNLPERGDDYYIRDEYDGDFRLFGFYEAQDVISEILRRADDGEDIFEPEEEEDGDELEDDDVLVDGGDEFAVEPGVFGALLDDNDDAVVAAVSAATEVDQKRRDNLAMQEEQLRNIRSSVADELDRESREFAANANAVLADMFG